MAGPFALPGNTASDIAPTQLAGGTGNVPAVDDQDNTVATIEAVGKAVNTIGELNQKRLENEAVNGVQTEIKAVRDALQISKHPNLQESFFSAEALQDPYIQGVYEQFNQIKSATAQGRLSNEYALERMDAVMSEAVSRRPQFADSIRKAGNDAAGANISSKMFTQIMSSSAQQDAQVKLQQEAARVGLPVEVFQDFLHQEFLRQQDMAAINYAKARGNVTLGQIGQHVGLGVKGITRDMQASLLATINAGGVVDVEATKAQIATSFTALRNDVLSGIPSGVDASQVNAQISTLEAEEARLIRQVESGAMVKVLRNKGELFAELGKETLRAEAPDEMMLFEVMGGGQAGLEAMNMYGKWKTNPTAFSGMYKLDNGGVLSFGQMLEQNFKAGLIMNGEQEAQNDQEKRLVGFLSGMRLKHDTTGKDDAPKPQEVVRLVDMVTNAGEEYSTITLADQQVATGVKQYKEVHPQVINHYNSDVAGLQIQYQQMKAEGVITDDMLSIKNGQVTVDQAQRAAQFGVGARTDANAQLSKFLRQTNQTLKLGRTYSANGVFPNTVFSGSDNYINTLMSGEAVQPTANTDKEVVNVSLNPDGSFTWE